MTYRHLFKEGFHFSFLVWVLVRGKLVTEEWREDPATLLLGMGAERPYQLPAGTKALHMPLGAAGQRQPG